MPWSPWKQPTDKVSAPSDEPDIISEQVMVRDARRFYEHLGPRGQVVLCQSPLTLFVALVAIWTPWAWPALLGNPLFIASLVLHAAIFLACFLVPWERFRPSIWLIIPILDLAAIFVTRTASLTTIPGLALLAIFPVIWLSASGLHARTSVFISFVGPFLISLPPLIHRLPNPTASDISAVIVVPLMMLSVSLAIHFASANVRLQQQRVEQKDKRLSELLAESRNRERLLKAILDTVDVGIVAVGPDGETLLTNSKQELFNKAAASNAGENADDEPRQLIFSQDRHTPLPPEKRPLQRAANGETYANYLVWMGEGPGQRAYFTAGRSMDSDHDGGFSGAVVVFSDVTDVIEALTAKEELVSNVSHEFGSPLTSILGNLDLVLSSPDSVSESARERLEVAQRNAERLRSLVSDLLLSASAVLNVHPRQTDLAGIIHNSIGSAQAQADAANVRLVTDVPVPLWASADPLRMAQALDNVVSNAIKYSPNGGVVTVTASTTGERVQVKVKDTGMGLSPDEAAKIFTRFYRSGAARKAAIPGAGLGLSITKTILERHGGSITCDSAPGKGSTFTLTLPARGNPSES